MATPSPKHVTSYDNGTSFDAFVAYLDGDGERAFLGVETKLTEPFTQSGATSAKAEPRYAALTERPDSVWREDAWPRRQDLRWRQLWQNHLLVEALRGHPEAPHGHRGLLVLVSHPDDAKCARTAADYKGTLIDPNASFVDLPLDALVPGGGPARTAEPDRLWLFQVERRYLDLAASSRARA